MLLLPSINTAVVGIAEGSVNSLLISPPASMGNVTTKLSEFAETGRSRSKTMSIRGTSPTIAGVIITFNTDAALVAPKLMGILGRNVNTSINAIKILKNFLIPSTPFFFSLLIILLLYHLF